jgi:hypothetical protein
MYMSNQSKCIYVCVCLKVITLAIHCSSSAEVASRLLVFFLLHGILLSEFPAISSTTSALVQEVALR